MSELESLPAAKIYQRIEVIKDQLEAIFRDEFDVWGVLQKLDHEPTCEQALNCTVRAVRACFRKKIHYVVGSSRLPYFEKLSIKLGAEFRVLGEGGLKKIEPGKKILQVGVDGSKGMLTAERDLIENLIGIATGFTFQRPLVPVVVVIASHLLEHEGRWVIPCREVKFVAPPEPKKHAKKPLRR